METETQDPILNNSTIPSKLAGIPEEESSQAHRYIRDRRHDCNSSGTFDRNRERVTTVMFLLEYRDKIRPEYALFEVLRLLCCHASVSPKRQAPLRNKVIVLLGLAVYFASRIREVSTELRLYLDEIRESFGVSLKTFHESVGSIANDSEGASETTQIQPVASA